MARSRLAFLGMALAATIVAGCQKEVVHVHKSSLANQFAQLNKNGWAVGMDDAENPGARKSPGDPNVRVIKEANFSNVRFNTNFQVDDPRLRAQMEHQNQESSSQNSAPPVSPFGPAPMVPR